MPEFYPDPPPPPKVNFITSNPALDEYLKAQKAAREQETSDTTNALNRQKLTQAQQQAPILARRLTAEASTAETGAQTAAATAQYAAPTAKAKLQEILTKAHQVDTNTKVVSMGIYQKQIAMAEAGDMAGAQAVAQQAGIHGIYPEVLQNAQARGRMKEIVEVEMKKHPNRPQDAFNGMTAQLAMAHLSNMPEAQPYKQAPGEAPPPETGGIKLGENQQLMQLYLQRNPGASLEKAREFAAGTAGKTEIERDRLAQTSAESEIHDTQVTDPDQRAAIIEKWSRAYGVGGMTKPSDQGQQQQPQPPLPKGVPPGTPQNPTSYSASRRLFRDPQGNYYDINGQLIGNGQQAAPQQQQQPQPQVPFSTQ